MFEFAYVVSNLHNYIVNISILFLIYKEFIFDVLTKPCVSS